MSRRELADAVNAELYAADVHDCDVDANYIGKLERGLHRWPNAARRRAFQRVLDAASVAALGFYDPRPTGDAFIAASQGPNHPVAPTMSSKPGPESADQSAAEPTAAARAVDHDEDVVDVLTRVHRLSRTINPEIVRQLDDEMKDLVARYEQFDHADIQPRVRKRRVWLDALLDEGQHPAQRRQLFEIAATTSGLLGYLAVGSSKFHLARAYCAEAFTLGDLAERPDVQAWARAMQSFCEYYAHDYAQALRFAEDGLGYANGGPQSVRLMINGVARALGKLGDADRVHRAVDSAYELMARNDVPDGFPSSVTFGCYSTAQTASNAATAYVSLAMADQAETYLDLALPEATRSGSPWTRSLVLLDQAAVLISSKSGDLEQASHLAIEAVDVSAGRPIVAVQQRTMEFLGRATKQWGDTKHIRAVRDALALEGPA